MQEDDIIGQKRFRENLCLVIFLCGQLSLLSAGKQTGQKVRVTPSAKAPRVFYIFSPFLNLLMSLYFSVTICSYIFLFDFNRNFETNK